MTEPQTEQEPRTEAPTRTEGLQTTDIQVSENSSGGTVIAIEPLPAKQSKRKFNNEDSSFQKRVRTDTQPAQSHNMTEFQISSVNYSKPLEFSAQAQSIHGPTNYSALNCAIKTEPQTTFENDFSVINPISAKFNQKPLIHPWAPVRHEMGPYVTSMPVGKLANMGHRPSFTYSDPENAYQMHCFQPWVNRNSEPDHYSPMTPIKRSADLYETESTNILKQSHGYSTPISTQKVNLTDCKTSLNSPVVDSRFNDSLTNLLGSPHTGSPISKNPFFSALQNALESDCKKEIVPQTLMDIHPDSFGRENIFTRERKLHERFNALQESSPDEVRQLSGFYRYQSALIETERFRTLHESKYPLSYKDTVNQHFDDKLHSVVDRVEQSIILLENANKENKLSNKGGKPRPHLNKEAVKIFEEWYQQNLDHPYPTSAVYDLLALKGGVSVEQVKKWFANKRNRAHNTRTLTEIAMKKRKLNVFSKEYDSTFNC